MKLYHFWIKLSTVYQVPLAGRVQVPVVVLTLSHPSPSNEPSQICFQAPSGMRKTAAGKAADKEVKKDEKGSEFGATDMRRKHEEVIMEFPWTSLNVFGFV